MKKTRTKCVLTPISVLQV